ncbi:MAG TPA: polymorphic toxin type 28 domain-containing protein, partial [Thermomicrobiaceae bacterium]|nr:polymorphic toxin type 28 domain-containing protein [Thermomicrobiaceae bacterium]
SPADQAVCAASLLVGGPEEESAAQAVTKTDLIKEQLTDETLQAAWREARGEVVKLKDIGEPYDHVTKVRQGQRALVKRIQAIKNRLSYANLNAEEVQPLIDELREASHLLDKAAKYLPR